MTWSLLNHQNISSFSTNCSRSRLKWLWHWSNLESLVWIATNTFPKQREHSYFEWSTIKIRKRPLFLDTTSWQLLTQVALGFPTVVNRLPITQRKGNDRQCREKDLGSGGTSRSCFCKCSHKQSRPKYAALVLVKLEKNNTPLTLVTSEGCTRKSEGDWPPLGEINSLWFELRARSHRTRKHICTQICMQTLWCCLQAVWTLLLTTMCSIICVHMLQGAPHPVWTGPKKQHLADPSFFRNTTWRLWMGDLLVFKHLGMIRQWTDVLGGK